MVIRRNATTIIATAWEETVRRNECFCLAFIRFLVGIGHRWSSADRAIDADWPGRPPACPSASDPRSAIRLTEKVVSRHARILKSWLTGALAQPRKMLHFGQDFCFYGPHQKRVLPEQRLRTTLFKWFGLRDNGNPKSLASRLRRKRTERFNGLLKGFPEPIRILDVGGAIGFWKINLSAIDRVCEITLLNLEAPEC